MRGSGARLQGKRHWEGSPMRKDSTTMGLGTLDHAKTAGELHTVHGFRITCLDVYWCFSRWARVIE